MPSYLIHTSPLTHVCNRPICVTPRHRSYILLHSTYMFLGIITTLNKTGECQGIQLRIPYTIFHQENIKIHSLKSPPPKVS